MSARSRPAPGHVDVWLLDGAGEAAGLHAVALAPEEEARAGRMATAALADRVRLRRRFLRRVLSLYLGLAPERVPLAADAGGKLRLAGEAGFHFNLSHSGEASVLAVGRSDLGIDIERVRAFDRLPALIGHACSPRERAGIMAAPDATGAFLDRWVLKEAILKCRGTGLVDDLGAVDPGPARPDSWRWDGLTLALPTLGSRLHAALAVEGALVSVAVIGCLPGIERRAAA